jgi:nitrate reductase gamma subunit
MRNLSRLGVALVVLGASALLMGHFSYFESKPVLDAGPIHVTAQEEHHLLIPTIAGIAVLIAGFGLMVMGRETA